MNYTAESLAAYLAPHLKPSIFASPAAIKDYAETILFEFDGRNDDTGFEVPSRYTVTGNPLPVALR